MTDIILVQPKVREAKVIKYEAGVPLALLSMCRYIAKDYNIRIIDQRIDKHWKKNLVRELKKKPLCVATTSMTGSPIKYALGISKIVKQNSDVPVIWGGIHASLLPKQTLENPYIDFVIQGEGEVAFYELVKALDRNKDLRYIKGLWYKEKEKIKHNPEREPIDLNKLPEIPFNIINIKDYISRDKKGIYLQTSRGCPGRCTFCYSPPFYKHIWRSLNPKKTQEMIKHVVDNFNVKSICFVDDDFFVDTKRVKEILRGIINENLDIKWYANSRINSIIHEKKNFFSLLKQAGCERLNIGIESGSSRILKLIQKDIILNQIIEFNKKIRKIDISPAYFFMCGFPTETKEELWKTIKLMFKLQKDNPNAIILPIAFYTPTPNTRLFDLSVKLGLKKPAKLEQWIGFDQVKINLPWLSEKEINNLYSLTFTSVFLNNDFVSYTTSKSLLSKILFKLYKPIALYRTKNLYFKYMIENEIRKLFN